jgi:4'-phosphopantetheinyl transferase EntD
MAAACAWRSASDYAAGVDLEQVRETQVAQSAYPFSARERALLAHVAQGPVLAGLAGWALKEAVWKALWPRQPSSPASVQIHALSLAPPRAAASVEGRYLTRGASTPIRVRLGNIVGADGQYVLAVAEVGRWESEAPATSRSIDRRHAPIDNLKLIEDPASVYAEVLDL